jgi:hypothetical protein
MLVEGPEGCLDFLRMRIMLEEEVYSSIDKRDVVGK